MGHGLLPLNFLTALEMCQPSKTYTKRERERERERESTFIILAHLSQRLIGELIVYSCSGVRPSVRRRRRTSSSSTISNIFFSETACLIKAKIYVEPPWEGGTKVCSRHLGHMTKMADTPIYGKNPSKIFFSRTCRLFFTKLGM